MPKSNRYRLDILLNFFIRYGTMYEGPFPPINLPYLASTDCMLEEKATASSLYPRSRSRPLE